MEQLFAQRRGLRLDPAVVDDILRSRIDHAAELLRISARSALRYVPEDLAERIVDDILAVLPLRRL